MSTPATTIQRETPFGKEQIRDLPWVKVIPYDYVADFPITGNVGNIVEDVINVSSEGVFVAVSIGYGFEEDRVETINLPEPTVSNGSAGLKDIRLSDFPPDALIEGIRIDPRYEAVAVSNSVLDPNLNPAIARNMFQRIRPPSAFGFLLSIIDSATGRELQNKPIHNVATLGGADGRRPFKAFSQPMVFMPRSTIRIQIQESTQGVKGRLFITIQGYKVLGVAGNLEEAVRRLVEIDPLRRIPVYDYGTGTYRSLGEAMERHRPTTGIVPFDYVSTLELKGTPNNIVEDEVPINIDGGFVALAVGYSLDARDTSLQVAPVEATQESLGSLQITRFQPAQALFDGIRIDPNKLRLAFTGVGMATVNSDLVGAMFQRLNLANDVKFLYSILDSGTGRELQNQPVHNIAGLGIANGDRPFRMLPKPMTFLPRSTIRVQVREISGHGRLYIVFQGYKILG
jgi:hypothetical protein